MQEKPIDDLALVVRLREGDQEAAATFFDRMDDFIKACCEELSLDDDVVAEMRESIKANEFERLSSYRGRGSLATFVKLTVRQLLAERLLNLLRRDQDRGWREFESCFKPRIMKIIEFHLGNRRRSDWEDAYQDVALAFRGGARKKETESAEDGVADADEAQEAYARLSRYRGECKLDGFVYDAVENILIDRHRAERSAQGQIQRDDRLPKAIMKLFQLDRFVFRRLKASAPATLPTAELLMSARAEFGAHLTRDNIELSRARVNRAAPKGAFEKPVTESLYDENTRSLIETLASAGDDPESMMLKAVMQMASDASLEEIEKLPEKDRILIEHFLEGTNPKGAPPTKQLERVFAKLRERLASRPEVVKSGVTEMVASGRRLSVQGGDEGKLQ
jgi:hypothetical protein